MAINQICSERNLSQDVIIEAIETSLISAYKKNFGGGQNIKATIDVKTGKPSVFAERIVVEEVQDDRFEISLAQARKRAPSVKLGTLVRIDITPKSFGRIAAQTAKQVILQRIREAERDALFSSYADREGELINGMVASITPHAITLNLGRTEAVMPRSHQVPGERYRIGQRVRAYVLEVRRSSRGPQIVVSRTHRHMLRRMLELEVPEIFNGTVEIKSISREAGSRSKVAVAALQEGVDPVGSCVGIRGMRIQSIVNELGGEKIDVVEWSGDDKTFIANSLSPAKVSYVILDSSSNPRTATVVVPDDQLSLAIGKEGQNARLAAKLTNWRIDIKNESVAIKEDIKPGDHVSTVAAEGRDILAMAEAILLGKKPVQTAKAEPALVEPQVEPEAEPIQAEVEQESVPDETAPVQIEPQEEAAAAVPATEAPIEEAEQVETVLPQEPEVVDQPVAEPTVAETIATLVPEKQKESESVEPKSRPARKKVKYEYIEDQELEDLQTSRKKSRSKRRRLIRDEESGELLVERRHKRDQEEDLSWEEFLDR
jgi:N utilization substance protein A